MRKNLFWNAFALSAALSFMAACTAPPDNMGVGNMGVALGELCGQSFSGAVVSQDPQDVDWRAETLIVGPIKCDLAGQIEMPLAVGLDKSRTWFLTETGDRLELRHQHLLEDGSLDPVTYYGGFSKAGPILTGQTWRAEFPADDITVKVFMENGLDVSVTNIWALEITPNQTLKYELKRENRDFRAVFDLSNPL